MSVRCTWPPAGCAVGAVTVWAWPMQPGTQTGSWAAALAAFAVGGALYVVRGARPEGAGA
ncbi:hypothetical protein [Streptomyces chiangmaiensis]|uniref:LPXTG cell wall anchor domain-containing protein n=1 Tax=Streptomyces chiangmaiensis TaxID=766497 RepID=A0ABU7FV94_9ACTN|nr:hypothetical protein [Streptomyces chiangmaiensis]MED7827723.1 hypothetical protein [Streptomyces chiangmaiensis]